MADRSSARWARRHPSLTFGVVGGSFALLFVLVVSARDLTAGSGLYTPTGVEVALVVGGFLGGALVSWLLWARLGGATSPRRGAAVGALVGLLALSVPFYLLEFATLAVEGIPFDPRPGAGPLASAAEYLSLLIATPLALGALGLIPTRGGTVLAGAVTGYLLARH